MEQTHKNTPAENLDRVWELADAIPTCMLTTWDGERQRSRPMSPHIARADHAIYFLFNADSAQERQMEEFPTILLSFADARTNKYVAMTGKAMVSNDRERIKELWSDFYKAWWDSENDPEIRLITFTPEDAELWDGANALAAGVMMLTSAITGSKPKFGENAKIQM